LNSRSGWKVNKQLLNSFASFCTINLLKQDDPAKWSLHFTKQRKQRDFICPNKLVEIEPIDPGEPLAAMCIYLKMKVPKQQFDQCVKTEASQKLKELKKEPKKLTFDTAAYRQELKAKLEKELTAELENKIQAEMDSVTTDLEKQKDELEEELDALKKQHIEYFARAESEADLHRKATGDDTEERNAKMSELANKKKSYLVEKRKFDKLKGDMDAMLSATRIFHTKLESEVKELETQETDDRFDVAQLNREYEELTAKVNAKTQSSSSSFEERELRDKIRQVKRQVSEVKQKRQTPSLPLEHAFWITYSKELSILNNYLIETHMTKDRNGRKILLSRPKVGLNTYKCTDTNYLKKKGIRCSTTCTKKSCAEIWAEWTPNKTQFISRGANFPVPGYMQQSGYKWKKTW